MAIIATLGDIVFSVSSNQVNTFSNMKWESSAKYATHNRHLKDSLLEYVGADPEKINFSMYFSCFLGVNPINEIIKLLNAERSGTVMRLIIGKKQYGKNKWIITNISKELERFDNKGNLLSAKLNISLMAYSER